MFHTKKKCDYPDHTLKTGGEKEQCFLDTDILCKKLNF
jgi:hypothetical protein